VDKKLIDFNSWVQDKTTCWLLINFKQENEQKLLN